MEIDSCMSFSPLASIHEGGVKIGVEGDYLTHLQHDHHLPVVPFSIAENVALQVMLNLSPHQFLALLQPLGGCFLQRREGGGRKDSAV